MGLAFCTLPMARVALLPRTTLVELDKINPTFKVNGVDLLQKVREMT